METRHNRANKESRNLPSNDSGFSSVYGRNTTQKELFIPIVDILRNKEVLEKYKVKANVAGMKRKRGRPKTVKKQKLPQCDDPSGSPTKKKLMLDSEREESVKTDVPILSPVPSINDAFDTETIPSLSDIEDGRNAPLPTPRAITYGRNNLISITLNVNAAECKVQNEVCRNNETESEIDEDMYQRMPYWWGSHFRTDREENERVTSLEQFLQGAVLAEERKYGTSSSSIHSSSKQLSECSGTNKFKFAEPLPPAKRPPGRQKSEECGASVSENNSLKNGGEVVEDMLSLCARSLDCSSSSSSASNDEQSHRSDNIRSNPPIYDRTSMSTLTNTEKIKMWLIDSCEPEKCTPPTPPDSEVPPLSTDHQMLLAPQNQSERMEFEESWENEKVETPSITQSEATDEVGSRTYRQWYIPQFLRGKFCIGHYLKKFCFYGFNCKYPHKVFDADKQKLENANLKDVMSVYQFVTENSCILLRELFQCLLNALIKFDRKKEVADLLDVIMKMDILDRTAYVKRIVTTLQTMGLTFKETVEMLVKEKENVICADILLSIVIEKREFAKNWSLINLILSLRPCDQQLDYGFVSDVMSNCIAINGVYLYKTVDEHIFQKHKIDFTNITYELKTSYLQRLLAHNLINEYNNLRNMMKMDSIEQLPNNVRIEEIPNNYEELRNSHNNHNENIENSSDDEASNCSVPSYDAIIDRLDHELNCNEICELKASLSKEDISDFTNLLLRYKGTEKSDSFAVNTVAHLTASDVAVAAPFWRMLKAIEHVFPDYAKDSDLKQVIEQITYNVLDYLTSHEEWLYAGQIVIKFMDDFNSFVRAREFKKNSIPARSLATRHLYICKILIRTTYLKEALVILMDPNFNLLKPIEEWKLQHTGDNDLLYRNTIVREFLDKSMDIANLKVAETLLRFIAQEKLDVGLDVWHWLNKLLVKMIDNADRFQKNLAGLLPSVMKKWCNKLSASVLRGLCIVLVPIVSERASMALYNVCSKHRVYSCYKGNESEILITTDMTDEEVYLVLTVFFHKIAKNNFPLKDFKVQIDCPKDIVTQPKILLNSNSSFKETKQRVAKVLLKSFSIVLNADVCSKPEKYILVKKNSFAGLIKSYQEKENATRPLLPHQM